MPPPEIHHSFEASQAHECTPVMDKNDAAEAMPMTFVDTLFTGYLWLLLMVTPFVSALIWATDSPWKGLGFLLACSTLLIQMIARQFNADGVVYSFGLIFGVAGLALTAFA